MKWKFFLKTVIACALLPGAVGHASEWPSKPLKLVVPFSAGGSTDATARLVAERLGSVLGQQVVVENRAGAASNIGGAFVAKAPPDGYTLLLGTSTLAVNVSLYKSMGFDFRNDLVPVSQIVQIPNVLVVNNGIPPKTLNEFVAHVRKEKGGVNYGSAGNGSTQHLAAAMFNSMAGTEMVQVPYKGGAAANTDLIAGEVQAVFAPLVEVLPFIESGKLRALAVTTRERSPRLPNVPAMGEVIPGYEMVMWNGVFAPKGTPPAVLDKLAAAIRTVTKDASVRSRFTEQGAIVIGSTPAEFQGALPAEISKWGRLVKVSGAQVD